MFLLLPSHSFLQSLLKSKFRKKFFDTKITLFSKADLPVTLFSIKNYLQTKSQLMTQFFFLEKYPHNRTFLRAIEVKNLKL